MEVSEKKVGEAVFMVRNGDRVVESIAAVTFAAIVIAFMLCLTRVYSDSKRYAIIEKMQEFKCPGFAPKLPGVED